MATLNQIQLLYENVKDLTKNFSNLLVSYHKRLELAEKKVITLTGIIQKLDTSIISDKDWELICTVLETTKDDVHSALKYTMPSLLQRKDLGPFNDRITILENKVSKFTGASVPATVLNDIEKLKQQYGAVLGEVKQLRKALAEKDKSINKLPPPPTNINKPKLKKVIKDIKRD